MKKGDDSNGNLMKFKWNTSISIKIKFKLESEVFIMKKRNLSIILSAVILTISFLSTTLAASSINENTSLQSENDTLKSKKERPELTDEMKAKIKAKKAEREAQIFKWNALTNEQKKEIYALQDQIVGLQQKIIDKYHSFDLMDKDTATQIKKYIEERNTQIKEKSTMPMMHYNRNKKGSKHKPYPAK